MSDIVIERPPMPAGKSLLIDMEEKLDQEELKKEIR